MVFIYYLEYSGYGQQDNTDCNEDYIYNDIVCVYNYLIDQLKIKSEDIILYGRSLGSGPSCYLAEKYPIGGYIFIT
jgi:hypothetical protein